MTALEATHFKDIAAWAEDDHAAALKAFQFSAAEILAKGHGFQRSSQIGGARKDWLPVCEKALIAKDAKTFFETEFHPLRAEGEGLFTGYYEPELRGSLTPSADYPAAIYAKPADPSLYTRRQIEDGALKGQGLELVYVSSFVDAFFMHVQGNGRVVLPDGQVLRLSFAGKNGKPYTGLGKLLLERGFGTPDTMSMQFLRDWLAQHPDEMRALLQKNESFIFFRVTEIGDPALGAIGASKVHLTPRRSLAVDRSIWAFGIPLFIETHQPPEAGGAAFNHLMIAQDTGTAIRGMVRGDIYWGWGEDAALNAGHMKAKGKLTALLPKSLVHRITL